MPRYSPLTVDPLSPAVLYTTYDVRTALQTLKCLRDFDSGRPTVCSVPPDWTFRPGRPDEFRDCSREQGGGATGSEAPRS